MIVEELKKSLYLASFQGKLSKTEPSDSSVDEALNSIIINKNIDNRELKKRKINSNSIELYNLPSSWRWVKLGYLCDVIRGLTFSTSYKIKKDNTILVLRGGNIDSKTEELIYNDNIYVDSSIPNENQYLKFGDTLIVASSGTKTSVGKSAYIHDINKDISFGGFMMVVRPYSEIANPKYISYQIKMYRNKIINDTNGYISNITNEILNNLMIPLPPIEEQQRIVDKIENLFEKLDQISPIEREISQLKQTFALNMKKSVLTFAFSGKITTRLKSDTSITITTKAINDIHNELINSKTIKEDKKVSKINLEEVPFSIPVEWEWSKLYFCLDVRDGTHDSPKYVKEGTPLITSKNLNKNGTLNYNDIKYLSDEDKDKINTRSKVEVGDILYAMIGSIGNPVMINHEPDFCIKNVALIKNPAQKYINNKYLYYYLYFSQDQMKRESSGGVQQFVSLNYLRNFYIPLPPIEEQQRIVEKIEQLLPLLNDIESIVSGE